MKMFRLLLPLIVLISLGQMAYAQADCSLNAAYFCDDFEAYTPGTIGPQSAEWTTWSGVEDGPEDGLVSADQAASGSQCLAILGEAGGGPMDVLLLLGNQASGRYRVQFKMYIPAGNGGYYNIQKTEVAGEEFAFQVDFVGGVATLDAGGAAAATASYPEDTWFVVDQTIDLDNDWTSLSIDGRPVYSWPYSHTALSTGGMLQIGGFDFFPLDANYDYYIDDLFIEGQPACTIDPEALVCDDIESLANEAYAGPTSSWWTTWTGSDGTGEDAIVSMDQAASGSYSLLIQEGQAQDALLLLGEKTGGAYTLQWMQYVPAGATAYYNIQEDEVAGNQWNLDVFFNDGGGAPGVGTVQQTGATFDYPEDEWFMVRQIIDLDEGGLALYIDGVLAEGYLDYTGLKLGSIDFFSIDAINRYYLDNVIYKEGIDCAGIDAVAATGTSTDSDSGADNGTAAVDATGGLGAYAYEWSNGETTASVTDLAPGDYTCTVSPAANMGGCMEDVVVTVSVGELTGTNDPAIVESVKLSPNPTQGYILLEMDLEASAEVQVDVLNVAGQLMTSFGTQNTQNPRFEMDMSEFANGVYFARIAVDGAVMVRRVMVQK